MKEPSIDIIDKSKWAFEIILEFYVYSFSEIIGVDFDYWVGDMREEDKQADRPSHTVDVAMFGDYFFDIAEMRTVVDNYKYWRERYGTREAVGQEVCEWHDYASEQLINKKNRISLFNWLNGCPRDIDENEEGANG